jgi:hypothetical protein
MGVAWQRPRAGQWSSASPRLRVGPVLAALCGALMLASCAHAPEGGPARLAHHNSAAKPSTAKPSTARHPITAVSRAMVRPATRAAVADTQADDTVAALPAATKAARPAPIPLPDKSLLERQGAPDCALQTEPAAPSEAEVKIKMLDHERRCYRQVEAIVRDRLDKLQDAVGATITAVEAREKVGAPR